MLTCSLVSHVITKSVIFPTFSPTYLLITQWFYFLVASEDLFVAVLTIFLQSHENTTEEILFGQSHSAVSKINLAL